MEDSKTKDIQKYHTWIRREEISIHAHVSTPGGGSKVRYKCAWCDHNVTRYGKKAQERKYHFCNKKCMNKYIKKYGPINTNNTSRFNRILEYPCELCGTQTEFVVVSGKYCAKCNKLKNAYNGSSRKNNITFKQYLYRCIDKNLVNKDHAIVVLNWKYKENL